MAKIHFTLQGKGGVGKSLVSALIAQHRIDRNVPLLCIDTDPVNATFSTYKAFSVQRVELMKGNKIDAGQFDHLMELIVSNPDDDIVIDNGASSFIPLSGYLVENDAVSILQSMGHEVVIHPVITGGQSMVDTLTGLDTLASQFPSSAQMIVWLNEYFGLVERGGKPFEQMKVYESHKSRIHGIVTLHQQSELFERDMKTLLEHRMTFAEVKQSPDLNFMAKNRLLMIQKNIWSQLDLVLGVGNRAGIAKEAVADVS